MCNERKPDRIEDLSKPGIGQECQGGDRQHPAHRPASGFEDEKNRHAAEHEIQ